MPRLSGNFRFHHRIGGAGVCQRYARHSGRAPRSDGTTLQTPLLPERVSMERFPNAARVERVRPLAA